MAGNSASSKPNRYGGDCDRCAGRVVAGEGLLAGKRRGRWQVRHVECNHEGARQVGPPMMSTGHNVPPGAVAVGAGTCGLTGVALDSAEGPLEGRNLQHRLKVQAERAAAQKRRDKRAREREQAERAEVDKMATAGFVF